MQEPEDIAAQGLQGDCPARQMLHGLVLRVQAACGVQRNGRDNQLYVHSWQCGRQGTAAHGAVHKGYFRQTRRRQGVHRQGLVLQAVCQWNTVDYQTEKQNEELPHECVGQGAGAQAVDNRDHKR